jgi:hypothetical protein
MKYEDIALQSSIQSVYWFIRLHMRTCVGVSKYDVASKEDDQLDATITIY